MRPEGSKVKGRAPWFWERLFRAFGIRGNLPDLIDPHTQLGITLADLTQPEYAWLGRRKRFLALETVGNAVGQKSGVSLTCGLTQSLVNVEQLFINNNSGTDQTYAIDLSLPNPFGASSRVQSLDTRQETSSVCLFRTGSNVVALGASALRITVPTGSTQVIPLNAIISGATGGQVTVYNATDAQNFCGGFLWSERALGDTE